MAIEYLGLSAINGPMVVLEGVSGAAYDEIVEMVVDGNKKKLGRVIEVYEDKAIIQVFEGTEGLGLRNVHTRLTGHPMVLGVSEDMLGRTMNGIGVPIDGLGEIVPEKMLDVNGQPLNPVTREYPRNYIRTGISAIDGLMTLIRGTEASDFLRKRSAPMISWLPRLCSRLLWAMTLTRNLPLSLPPWVLSMMWRISSAGPLRKAVFPPM